MKKNISFSHRFTYNRLFRNCRLLLTCPREFLYSFTISSERSVAIEPYHPRIAQSAKQLMKKLSLLLPGATIQFIGSAALGVAGMSDIDLLIEAMNSEFPLYLPLLTQLFGDPLKEKSSFIEWRTVWKGYPTEVLLIDPKSRMYQLEMEAHLKLKASQKNRLAYQRLKLSSQGISKREYQRRKLAFYHDVLEIRHFPQIWQKIVQPFSFSYGKFAAFTAH